MSRIFIIEGNIGAGKTTLINEIKNVLSRDKNIIYVLEPVEDFQHFKIYNPLDEMHTAPVASQIHINNCLFNAYKNLDFFDPQTTYIMDRCIFSQFVFIEALFSFGKISPFEKDILFDICKITHKKLNLPKVTGIFFMKIDAETCLERIALRSRLCEQKYETEYLLHLELSYESFLERVAKEGYSLKVSHSKNLSNLVKEFLDFIKYDGV